MLKITEETFLIGESVAGMRKFVADLIKPVYRTELWALSISVMCSDEWAIVIRYGVT